MSKSKKKSQIIAFIPARSGSTRVKNKNIRLIKDRPLIYWSIYKAIISKVFDKIIIAISDGNKKNYLFTYTVYHLCWWVVIPFA